MLCHCILLLFATAAVRRTVEAECKQLLGRGVLGPFLANCTAAPPPPFLFSYPSRRYEEKVGVVVRTDAGYVVRRMTSNVNCRLICEDIVMILSIGRDRSSKFSHSLTHTNSFLWFPNKSHGYHHPHHHHYPPYISMIIFTSTNPPTLSSSNSFHSSASW